MKHCEGSADKVFQGIVYPQDRERDPYLLLPFEVPSGVRAIEIEYDYGGEGNVLDLGVFDPRGHEFLSAQGFRGWSGSARKHVVIGERWATPGYLPGPIYPGTWHVILGLYRVSPGGCAYEVKVRLYAGAREVPREETPSALSPIALQGYGGITKAGWVKGDLHCHTRHSEAQGSVGDLVRAAERKGLDFLAITDHNTVSHWRELEELEKEVGIVLIPGEEVTTYWGHANVWGKGSWLDFRCRTREQIKRLYGVAASEGRIFSVNHPKPGGPPWEFGFEVPFDCLEVWHGLWAMGNEASLCVWNRLLRQGRRVVAVGGSDTHPVFLPGVGLVEWLGLPTTWVMTGERTSQGILEGIRRGRVSISACPWGPFVSLSLEIHGETFLQGDTVPPDRGKLLVEVLRGEGLQLELISARGTFVARSIETERWEDEIEVDLKREIFVRAELRVPIRSFTPTKGPMAAITNPIWREVA